MTMRQKPTAKCVYVFLDKTYLLIIVQAFCCAATSELLSLGFLLCSVIDGKLINLLWHLSRLLEPQSSIGPLLLLLVFWLCVSCCFELSIGRQFLPFGSKTICSLLLTESKGICVVSTA